ncbi:MAG TPA: ankyrin repeat domain-containing protein, partial [Leptospiraceae bacterium]|nr:ankyrin repeat domain-containing protein [Leptospiraceae bacterium]
MKKLLIITFFILNISLYANNWNDALYEASENGDLNKVKLAIEKGAKVDYQSMDKGGTTPLMIASEKGYIDIIKFLLGKKAKVNLKDNEEY